MATIPRPGTVCAWSACRRPVPAGVPAAATVFTVAPIVFGLDKFAPPLTDWPAYRRRWSRHRSWHAQQAMYVVGVVEIIAGVVVALALPRYGALLVAAWLAGIIVNLLLIPGYYDIALRDYGLLIAALALNRLAVAHDPDAGAMTATVQARSGQHLDASATDRRPRPEPDLAAAWRAIADLLTAWAVTRPTRTLADTPSRVPDSYAELLTPPAFDLTTFPNVRGTTSS